MTSPYVTLDLLNPSPYKRRGHVITPWRPIAEKAGAPRDTFAPRVELKNSEGKWVPVRAQVDRLDKNDSSRDQLVLALSDLIDPGDEDYGTPGSQARVYTGEKGDTAGPFAEQLATGITLLNERLELWINTSEGRLGAEHAVFGGAVTSVQLHKWEMLDAFNRFRPDSHHPYKRCMQIDRIHMVRPPWDKQRSFNVYPATSHWEPVYVAHGAVRAIAVIASAPFAYECVDADGTPRTFDCRLHRSISLFEYADWVTDEMWLEGTPRGGGDPVLFWFSPRYFMLMELSLHPHIFRYPNHPGWFAITSSADVDPKQGYAFSTDAQAGPIWNPPLEYPDRDTEHRAFSWELAPTRSAHSIHLFRLGTTPKDLADAAGYRWYDLAYKPIRAKLEGR